MDSGITGNPSLDISTRTMGGITIAELAGELDIASAPALREQLLSLLCPGSSRLFIDLSKVRLCDASGLAVLVGIGRLARLLGGFLRLAAVSPQVGQVLHPTGLHRHLPYIPAAHAAAAGTHDAQHSRTGAVAEIATPLKRVLDAGAGLSSAETERAVTGGARTCSARAAATSLAQSQRMWSSPPLRSWAGGDLTSARYRHHRS